MTRLGFLIFNVLLLFVLYGSVYVGGAKPASIAYTIREFSEPYIAIILMMIIYNTIRWFMSHDPEVANEIVTWLHAFWLVPVLTILAIYLVGGIEGGFWQGLKGLLALR